MGSSTVTTTWSLGINNAEVSGYPIFLWGRRSGIGVGSPVYFSSQFGDFTLALPRQDKLDTKNIFLLIERLVESGMSEPPELRKVQEIYERFADNLHSKDQSIKGKARDQMVTEWRKLLGLT